MIDSKDRSLELKFKNSAGFTYIEVMMAMAILVIVMVPVFPALSRAMDNHRFAAQRGVAQGYAVALALEVRAAPGDAGDIVERIAQNDDGYFFRVSLVSLDGEITYYAAGAAAQDSVVASFSTDAEFGGLFEDGVFVVAEVFDERGLLAGLSVGKVNDW